MPATLEFVRDCGVQLERSIVWLEYAPDGEKQRKFRVVDHGTAARNGEPYEALLRERKYLPNPVTRFCTTELLCGDHVYVAPEPVDAGDLARRRF